MSRTICALAILFTALCTEAKLSDAQHRSILRPPERLTLMSDSLYNALSAMPLDSLNALDYYALLRERRLRALADPNAVHNRPIDALAFGYLVMLGFLFFALSRHTR